VKACNSGPSCSEPTSNGDAEGAAGEESAAKLQSKLALAIAACPSGPHLLCLDKYFTISPLNTSA
jgi:hypothetical protein